MILLYPSEEQAFDSNGQGALSDCISCQVTEERNGAYELQMEYPIDGIHYSEIAQRSILFAKPTPYEDPQPFRVYRITKPLNGRVTVYAQHLSYDLSGIPVSPFAVNSVTGAFSNFKTKAAVENPFTFWTDKTTQAAFSVETPASIRSLLGGSQGSILDVYGGEYEFDRWTVRLWNQRGQDSGVTIRYGKNLTDLQQDENISNVATGVYPYWKSAGEDATLVELPEKIVNAPGTYNFTRVVPLDLSAQFDEQPTVAQLRTRAQKYVEDNNIGIPTVSLTVAFQPLDQTEEYKNLALLERVNLCDTVTVEYPELGVSAKAKCIRTVYDVLKGRYARIELGDARANIADTILSQEEEIKKAPTTSYIKQAVNNATSLITGNKGGYVVLRDTNNDGEPDEILIMNTPDVATATKVWRWNNAGLGYSSNGYNGPYTTAITQNGAIVANFITAGELNGSIVKTGRIESHDGAVYFDLDKDELAASKLVDPNGNVYAVVGRDIDLAADGFFLYKDNKKFAQLYLNGENDAELLSTSGIGIRSHGGTGASTNIIYMDKDSSGNGEIYISRANGSSSVTSLYMGAEGTYLRNPDGLDSFQADKENTVLRNPKNGVIFLGDSQTTNLYNSEGLFVFQASHGFTGVHGGNSEIYVENNKISFRINGAVKAYIDSSGFHNA